jgi:putative two-component system response regulator
MESGLDDATDSSSGSSGKPTILIVDDTPDNIALIGSFLRDAYRVKAATTGAKALQIAGSNALPDLILLDIVMPGMDGYEVCRRLKADPKTADIPVIFLTARSEVEDEKRGFELGAVDFIIRPVSPHIVQARVKTHLQMKSARDFLKDKSAYLEREVAHRTQEIVTIQDVTMVALGSLAETRDNETGNHIRRTQHYVEALSLELKDHPRFAGFFTGGSLELIHKSAPLHDIGKVGIPDHILMKPGKLTEEEFSVMKRHTSLGHDSILRAEKLIRSDKSFLRFAREIAHSHHEKWDGTGYPSSLAGDEIPVPGRLMAVADVYDALISRRVYKPAFPHEKAAAIILEGARTHFDPDVAEAFRKISGRFHEIAGRYADGDPQ